MTIPEATAHGLSMSSSVHPGRFLSRARLLSDGMSRRSIDRLLDAGRLLPVRRGLYALADTPADEIRAATLGAQVGCLSAAKNHGLWVPPNGRLHIVRSRNLHGVAIPDDVVRHTVSGCVDPGTASIADCVHQVMTFHSAETGLIVLESAARLERLPYSAVRALLADVPACKIGVYRHFSERSEGGNETRPRLSLQRMGVRVRAQVTIDGIGRVDLLVGRSLIVECDSARHHTSSDDYRRDRQRDLRARSLGYTVIRLTWEQIFLDWANTRRMLSAVLKTRRHDLPPRPGARESLQELHSRQWWMA